MSVRQGSAIETVLTNSAIAWNMAWDGGPIVAGPASPKQLAGGLRITVLSPRRPELDRLAKHWQDQLERGAPKRPKVQESEDEPTLLSRRADVLVLHSAKDAKWKEVFERQLRQSESGVTWGFESLESARLLGAAPQSGLPRVVSSAGKVLLLISAHALESRGFTQQVLPLLEDASASERRFGSWALIGRSEWQRLPLAQVQAAHDIRKPLSGLSATERDRVVRGIIQTMESMALQDATPQAPAAKTSSTLNVEALANAAFSEDAGIANAASIAFLAEFNGKALLVGGDARSDVLCDSIRSLLSLRAQKRLRLDAFVIPHGGSQRNLSRQLLDLLECDRYLVSTNGAVFQHPNRETIARIITFGRAALDRPLTLVFNYRSQFTEVWANPELQQRYRYTAIYPQQPGAGVKVQI